MQKSAFKYHASGLETYNTLQYYTALKRAKILACPEGEELSKRKSLDRLEEGQGYSDVFCVQRPSNTLKEG